MRQQKLSLQKVFSSLRFSHSVLLRQELGYHPRKRISAYFLIINGDKCIKEYSELVNEYKGRKEISDDLKKEIEEVLKPRVHELKNTLELFKQNTEIKNLLDILGSIETG